MLKTHETMFINGREVKLTEKRRAAGSAMLDRHETCSAHYLYHVYNRFSARKAAAYEWNRKQAENGLISIVSANTFTFAVTYVKRHENGRLYLVYNTGTNYYEWPLNAIQ